MEDNMRRVDFNISESSHEYIHQVMKRTGLKKSHALMKILEEHEGTYIEESIADIRRTSIRNNKVVNSLEQKVDILLNILNSMALNGRQNEYFSPDKLKSPLYEKAEQEVKAKKEREMAQKRK